MPKGSAGGWEGLKALAKDSFADGYAQREMRNQGEVEHFGIDQLPRSIAELARMYAVDMERADARRDTPRLASLLVVEHITECVRAVSEGRQPDARYVPQRDYELAEVRGTLDYIDNIAMRRKRRDIAAGTKDYTNPRVRGRFGSGADMRQKVRARRLGRLQPIREVIAEVEKRMVAAESEVGRSSLVTVIEEVIRDQRAEHEAAVIAAKERKARRPTVRLRQAARDLRNDVSGRLRRGGSGSSSS